MKKILVLVVVAVLLFAGCTVVKEAPDIDGTWNVNASIEGAHYTFEMTIEAGEYVFDAVATDGFVVSGGRYALNGKLNFLLIVDGREYGFYGDVAGDYMSGFLRKGIQGGIVGNWSASR
jgi:hypothetical protein